MRARRGIRRRLWDFSGTSGGGREAIGLRGPGGGLPGTSRTTVAPRRRPRRRARAGVNAPADRALPCGRPRPGRRSPSSRRRRTRGRSPGPTRRGGAAVRRRHAGYLREGVMRAVRTAAYGPSVVSDAGTAECGHRVLRVGQGAGAGTEPGGLVHDGPADGKMAPDAAALVGGGFPGRLVDDEGVPADFPLETRGGDAVGQVSEGGRCRRRPWCCVRSRAGRGRRPGLPWPAARCCGRSRRRLRLRGRRRAAAGPAGRRRSPRRRSSFRRCRTSSPASSAGRSVSSS